CPGCFRRYQLKPEMQGKQTQCHNPLCRTIFEVRAADEVPEGSIYPIQPAPEANREPAAGSPPAEKKSWSGSVGDLIPMLEAEEVAEAPRPEEPREAAPPGGSVGEILPGEAVDIPEVEAP